MSETNENQPEGIEPEAAASPNEETQLSPTTEEEVDALMEKTSEELEELLAEADRGLDESLKNLKESTAKLNAALQVAGTYGPLL